MIIKSFPYCNSLDLFSCVSKKNGAVFLDSARFDEQLGRYSYFAFDPFLILKSKNNTVLLEYFEYSKKIKSIEKNEDPFNVLENELNRFQVDAAFPILQGGAIGYFGYDLCHHLENIPRAKKDDMDFPDLILGFYDFAVTFDHVEKKAWVASNGFPEQNEKKRMQRAEERLAYFLGLMDPAVKPRDDGPDCYSECNEESLGEREILRFTQDDAMLARYDTVLARDDTVLVRGEAILDRSDNSSCHPGKREALIRDPYIKRKKSRGLAPETKGRGDYQGEYANAPLESQARIDSARRDRIEETITSNFSREQYLNAVQKVIDYILAGDIFEANISQRFTSKMPKGVTPFELYTTLREINSAPFAAYLNFDDVHIASASPERFLRLKNREIETRPIKGTRPRGKTPEEDKAFSEELVNSEKDWAENVMIVDLMRNDLSRVCEAGSVNVTQLCGLESFATVHHLVSAVKGRLKKEKNVIDVLRATFPGGSITGAPKIRSMEIISELEPTQRGPYCGSIGFIGFDGNMDTSITIRTFAIKNNTVTFQAGGAVVLDSKPDEEYEETLAKIDPLKHALQKR